MRLLHRLRDRLSFDASRGGDASPIAEAERLLRDGAGAADIRRAATRAVAESEAAQAWRALFLGDMDAAFRASYSAADSRPYDVDSRIVHGTVRLARNELDHAEHEFDAVIEEFGAESDAADGRRAVMLARGFAPLDELPASEADWESAAVLLTTLWRVAGLADERLAALGDAHPDSLSLIRGALEDGRARDSEADDGAA